MHIPRDLAYHGSNEDGENFVKRHLDQTKMGL